MSESGPWHQMRERVESLEPGTAFRTPVSERRFRVARTFDDRVVVAFADSGEERSLWRAQFEVLADRLADGPVAVADLAPGVEPYAAVLSVVPDVVVEDGELRREVAERGESTDRQREATESPLVVPPEAARTEPQQVHDDAVLLADLLDASDLDAPRSMETSVLVDVYVLLSDVQRGADGLRREVSSVLLDRLGPGQQLSGTYGTVSRAVRERRTPKDEETVLAALDRHGVPREWVLGIDPEKLDVVLAATDVDESEVYDVEEGTYVQKTGVAEREKYDRLQGLRGRLEAVESEAAEQLREELDDLERRLDELLAME